MTGIVPDGTYTPYSVMRRNDTKKVPELIEKHMPSSDLWVSENESDFTNCVTVLLPREYADCYLMVRVGYAQGFAISNWLGLGEPDTLQSL